MPKRKRTEANLEAERRWKESTQRVHLQFHLERDAELLEWLRSQSQSQGLTMSSFIKHFLQQFSQQG